MHQTHIFAFILFITIFQANSHIYSSTPKITYNYLGKPAIYHLYISLQTGLGQKDYLKIIFPQSIHQTTLKQNILVKLISFSNNLQISSTHFINLPADTNPNYFVTFGHSLTSNKWYQIQIYPTKDPATLSMQGLIQIQALSSSGSNPIIYDSNYAFTYIKVQSDIPVVNINSLIIAASSSSLQKQRTASIYTLNIDITPTISSSNGGNFTLMIYYDGTAPGHTSGTTDLDFQFMGLCQSVNNGAGYTAVLNYCQISSDLSTITFSMNAVSTQKIRISTQVSNPLYVSTRGIKGYWVNFISGKVYENGFDADALSVNPIVISAPSSGRAYILWGIDKDLTGDPDMANVPLGIYKAAGSNIGPFNSFNIGFQVAQTSPINGLYRVIVKLGATGILQGTIAHNLPSFNGLSIYCHYDTSLKQIQCENVGAFINTASLGYRYFISGKAYFASTTIDQSTFGDVDIKPIILDNTGAQLPVSLFTPYTSSQTVSVYQSKQNLDISGFHNTNIFKLGNAQVVSFKDNGALSSTGDAIQQFLQGTNSSVGIIPDLGQSQQLLFLMKLGGITASSGNYYHLKLLYNNKIIGFESGSDFQQRGLDFVGYENGTGNWSISYAPCHQVGNIVCQKYNVITPSKNIQVRVGQSSTYNNYGMYKFQCGQAYVVSAPCIGGDCSSQCNMFSGYGTTDLKSSVVAMRKVTFPNGYHSSIYADNNLLDFLFVFHHNTTLSSICLINGYTISGKKMDNIKASYVNYYHDGGSNYNKGIKMPMMIRIGGGVLPTQSLDATVMAVYFDDNIKADTFYTQSGSSYDIGCSTNNCKYYPNNGYNIPRNDIWHTNRAVYFFNIPPIQNQFNILAPVTPSSSAPPKYLTIAFFIQNHTIAQATNLLTTVSVFRLFGPIVTQSISGSIGTINGLATTTAGSGPGIQFQNTYSGASLNYRINIANINSNPPNNTFLFGSSLNVNEGSAYGAGITITSFYYNIFASSTLKFQSPPLNTAQTCTIFGYIYNQIQNPGTNLDRDKKWIYTAFCPTDSSINLNSADGNIQFLNPQYPDIFTNGFPLQEVISYGHSNQNGELKGFDFQTQSITTFTRACSTSKLQSYNPYQAGTTTGAGKQRATFAVIAPQILMATNGVDGYPKFKVIVNLPTGAQSVVGTSLQMSNLECDISDPLLLCNPNFASSTRTDLIVSYIGTGTYTVTNFQLGLYAEAIGAFNENGTSKDYTLNIQLPQQLSSNRVIFGTAFASYKTSYCTCTSRFSVGITPNGKNMVFNTFFTQTSTKLARSPIQFNFASDSYRQTFFKSSYYQFNFGFLTAPFNTDLSKQNLRCLIYQNLNGVLTLSTKWKSLSLTFNNLNSVQLYSKQEIYNPKLYLFTMKCFGSGVPDGTNSTSMSLSWIDSGNSVQSATDIPQVTTFISATGLSLTVTVTKRFVTQGFKSFYKFAIRTSTVLDQNSRIYLDFHMKLNTKLDSQGIVQCYTTLPPGSPLFTYCQFTQDRKLVVWNNQIVPATTSYFIQVFNIQQPKSTDISSSNQLIYVTVDTDDDFTNGIYQINSVGDISPTANSIKKIIIHQSTINTTYIRSLQTISIKFKLQDAAFSGGQNIYLVLPSSYAEWITRGDTKTVGVQCSLIADGGSSQLVTVCQFISKRILKISLISDANFIFNLIVKNVISPSSLPLGKNNQFRYKLYISESSEQNILYYSFLDYSSYLTLQTNNNLIDLAWKQFTIIQSDSLVTLTQNLQGSKNIYVGYYSNVLELRQAIYPNNFRTTMQLEINNMPVQKFITLKAPKIQLGASIAYLRMAANSTVLAGLYTLQFSKNGDVNNIYSAIPPLTLVVSSKKCALKTKKISYNIPFGGSSLPIVIQAMQCIPLEQITIGVTFSAPGLQIHPNLSSVILSKNSLDGKMYIVVRHTSPALTIGTVVTMSFTISGPNSASYDLIPDVTITIIDSTPYQVTPSATTLSNPTLKNNTATFIMQCNMPSTIYWGVGIYPSILNSQALDFQARIISSGSGLITNYTQLVDSFYRVYGINYVPTTQTLLKTLYGLKSNENYIFKYFCVNQMGFSSDSRSINFASLNYGAYLMKVTITFKDSINYGQFHDLSCSLAQNFNIPYVRVMTQAMSNCQSISTIFYKNNSSPISNSPDTNGQYLYNFYILPDYNLAADNTNINIRSNLALHSFTTSIITSTVNFALLPQFVQMQTQDIQFFTSPLLSFGTPLSGLNSVTVKGSITNMNGFIIVGIKLGSFSLNTMSLPTSINIKKGLFQNNIPLFKVRMQYVPQNYEVDIGIDELNANTQYTMFYFGTTDDPTLTADTTQVSFKTFTTLEVLDININWGFRQVFISSFMIIIIIILV